MCTHDRETGAKVVIPVRAIIVVDVARTAIVGVADIEAAPASPSEINTCPYALRPPQRTDA